MTTTTPEPATAPVTFTATQARTLLALIEDAEQAATETGFTGTRYTELYTIIDAAIIR